MSKHNAQAVAKALIRAQAVEALSALTEILTAQKPSLEQLRAARRARQNAELIRTLDRK